jgi:Xaa-Pro aminopeptidase
VYADGGPESVLPTWVSRWQFSPRILTRLYFYTLCPPTQRGAYPSPLNYHGFPKSCCTSVNEVICHGIPDDRKLEDGDIINLDITVYLDGFHGDCSEMFVAGELDDAGKDLVQATYDSWISACKFVESGKDYKDIGAIIEDHVTPRGYSSVRNFCGHGIGSVGECIRPRQLIPERTGDTLTLYSCVTPFPPFLFFADLSHQSQHFTLPQLGTQRTNGRRSHLYD